MTIKNPFIPFPYQEVDLSKRIIRSALLNQSRSQNYIPDKGRLNKQNGIDPFCLHRTMIVSQRPGSSSCLAKANLRLRRNLIALPLYFYIKLRDSTTSIHLHAADYHLHGNGTPLPQLD